MRIRLIVLVLIFGVVMGTALSLPQRQETVLTVALPRDVINRVDADLFDDFETTHNVNVVPVPVGLGDVPFISTGILNTEGALDAVATYASTADVLYLPSDGVSLITTETGYLLDLEPLLRTQDTDLAASFFPNLWASFQWSGSTWAVPVGASLQLLLVDTDAFDMLGLPYPAGDWTPTQFTDTLDTLATDDRIALDVFNTALMLRALAGVQLYDPNALRPQLTAEVADALDLWTALEAEGTVDRVGLVRDAPLRLDEFNQTSVNAINADAATRVALLPGNIAGMRVDGFGISAGTANPELAFELLVYLSTLPDLPPALNLDVSARTDLPDGNGGAGPYIRGDFSTDDATLLNDLLPNALPAAELHFEPYFNVALDQLAFNGGTGADAVAIIEDQITADRVAAAARRDEQLLVIAPTPTPIPEPETVRIRFGLPINAGDNNSNFDRWVDAAREFAAEDAVVDQVDLITGRRFQGWEQQTTDFDCFYHPTSGTAFPYEQVVLNLDPLFDSDPTFDEADVLPTVLDTVRVNGELWSVPLHVDPQLLYYDFMALGDVLDRRWTVNDMDVLFAAADPADGPLFTYQFDFRLLELLVAAYGGTLFDYSTEPPTVRFTEADTISALNRVIGLIDEGLIATSEMIPGPSSPIAVFPGSPLQSTRYQPDGYDWLLPPRSEDITPLSYMVGVGYISATTTQPEACFRWLRAISENPTLLPGLPAITAAQNTPEYTAVRSPREVSILSAFSGALQDDNVQRLPLTSNFSGSRSTEHGTAYGQFSQAIMTVIEEDRDLETALEIAAEQIEGYYACAALIPPATTDPEDLEAFGRAHLTCLVQVDPEVLQRLGVESIDELYGE